MSINDFPISHDFPENCLDNTCVSRPEIFQSLISRLFWLSRIRGNNTD